MFNQYNRVHCIKTSDISIGRCPRQHIGIHINYVERYFERTHKNLIEMYKNSICGLCVYFLHNSIFFGFMSLTCPTRVIGEPLGLCVCMCKSVCTIRFLAPFRQDKWLKRPIGKDGKRDVIVQFPSQISSNKGCGEKV